MNSIASRRFSWMSLAFGLAALLLCVAAAVSGDRIVFRAYLYAYLFWLGLSLGSLGLLMIHNLAGGRWGKAVRPGAEAGVWTLPLMAVLFVPILLGMKDLYGWAQGGPTNELLQHRAIYLNVGFFAARAGFYFAIWLLIAAALRHWRNDPAVLRRISAVGLIVYLVTLTHAVIDWVMSRDTAFYSTAYGLVFATGQAVSAFAFLIVMFWALAPPGATPAISPTEDPLPSDGLRGDLISVDLANLLLTMIILWAYIQFFQLLVIWMGNLREDSGWYIDRGFGEAGDGSPWRWVGFGLVAFHFFLPFFLLLFRRIKKNLRSVAKVAGLVLLMHLVEQYWMVAPSDGHGKFAIVWADLVTPIAIGGIWMFVFLRLQLRREGVVYAV